MKNVEELENDKEESRKHTINAAIIPILSKKYGANRRMIDGVGSPAIPIRRRRIGLPL